jgi:hypothetical protein
MVCLRGLPQGFLAHQRVNDGLQPQLGRRVIEDKLPHLVTVQRAIGRNELIAKLVCDGLQGSTTRRRDLARDGICIHQRCAAIHQHTGNRAFAAADTARQTNA